MNNNFSIAFHLGSLEVRWYSIFILVGIIATFITAITQAKIQKIPIRPLENFLIIGLVCSYIGARIWFLIGNHSYVRSFYDVIAIWNGGVSIEGAAITGSLSGLIYFNHIRHKYKVSMWIYFDIIMSSILIGQVIGRWGNFFNQEILGPKTSHNAFPLFLLPNYIRDHLLYSNDPIGTYRQPLFLYESFFNFLTFIFLLFITNNKYLLKRISNKFFKRLITFEDGSRALYWFVWYGLLRTILEPFRGNVDILKINSFPISELISVLYFLIGSFAFAINQKYIILNFWEKRIRIL